jgi:hypothetical protein
MTKTCLLCSKVLNKKQNKFCSVKCARIVGNKALGKILHERVKDKYPRFMGKCKSCGNDIIAKNASFVKKNRQFCSISCKNKVQNKNRILTPEQRTKMAERARKIFTGRKLTPEQCERRRINNLGNKSHFWLGGLTEENRKLRNCAKTKKWRDFCFKRDNYTCQDCKMHGGRLCVHHIINWSDDSQLRWEVNNGITLCWKCHYARHKKDNFWKRRLHK